MKFLSLCQAKKLFQLQFSKTWNSKWKDVKEIFMSPLCETYVSQGRTVRFPCGKRMVSHKET